MFLDESQLMLYHVMIIWCIYNMCNTRAVDD